MATWKDRYRQASFRGIEFFVQDHSVSGGRRIVKHEYPGRDDAEYDDLGKQAPTVTIDAYVLKDSNSEYDIIRDRLENAFANHEAPGKLVIPTKQIDLWVRVSTYTLSETQQEGGIAKFNVQFLVEKLEKAETRLSKRVVNPKEQLSLSKESAWDAVRKNFNEKYVDKLTNAVNRLNVVNDILQGVADGIFEAKKIYAPIAEFKSIYSTFQGKIVRISLGLTDFANELRNLVDFGTDSNSSSTPANSTEGERTFKDMYAFASTMDINSTQPDEQAVAAAVAVGTIASATTALQFVEFTTAEQVQETRDSFFAVIDSVGEAPIGDDEYVALQDIKTAVVQYLDSLSDTLRSTRLIQLVETMPSLAVSDMLYADLNDHDSLIQVNNIRHPMFVPGGTPLKVFDE